MTRLRGCGQSLASSCHHQQGAVLLLMLLGLMLSGTSAVLALQGGVGIEQNESFFATATEGPAPAGVPVYLRAERDAKVLHQAKIALLAYAATYADNYTPSGAGPGHFPCPDLDPPDDNNPHNDGPNPPCSHAGRQVGRMPRLTTATKHGSLNSPSADETAHLPDNNTKVLEFYPLLTHLDQQPWYLVDDGFVNNPLNRQVNFSTRSHLSNRHQRQLVAMVIAPGASIAASGQHRPSTSNQDYLEQSLAALTSTEGSRQISRDYSMYSNDIVTPVYLDELMPLLQARVAGFVRDQLLAYRKRYCSLAGTQPMPPCFPFAAEVIGSSQNNVVNAMPTGMPNGNPLTACTSGLYQGMVPVETGNCAAALSIDGALQGVEMGATGLCVMAGLTFLTIN